MDTFFRYYLILSVLKPYPRRMSTTQIMETLRRNGVDKVGIRMIQRDLEKLSSLFPIDSDQNRPRGWCWARDGATLLPGMDLHTALTFRLMEEYLQPLIPSACLTAAHRHFSEAAKLLERDSIGRHQAWLDKVKIISRGQPLLPATIKEDVFDTVYEALFSDRRLAASYTPRNGKQSKEYLVNPLGLVFVNKSPYLVATLWDYDDIKQLALHRFEAARLLDEPVREVTGFSLDSYVREQKEFDYPESGDVLKLVASFTPPAAHHLHETPLSEDQEIRKVSDEEVIVSATVHDTAQLRWWLLGFGAEVAVLEPKALREEMRATVLGMAERYSSAGLHQAPTR